MFKLCIHLKKQTTISTLPSEACKTHTVICQMNNNLFYIKNKSLCCDRVPQPNTLCFGSHQCALNKNYLIQTRDKGQGPQLSTTSPRCASPCSSLTVLSRHHTTALYFKHKEHLLTNYFSIFYQVSTSKCYIIRVILLHQNFTCSFLSVIFYIQLHQEQALLSQHQQEKKIYTGHVRAIATMSKVIQSSHVCSFSFINLEQVPKHVLPHPQN